jgi:hypothetical protein
LLGYFSNQKLVEREEKNGERSRGKNNLIFLDNSLI